MQDIIIIAVLILIFGLSIGYIVKAKKKGVKCIGCEHATKCSGCENHE